MKITLIGSAQAKIGHKFLFEKGLPECDNCKFKQVCVDNLEEGRIYKIIKIRPKKHPCKVFEHEVVIVEVEMAKIDALINKKIAFEGAVITYNTLGEVDIPQSLVKYKDPQGLKDGDKCKIIKILDIKEAKKTNYRVAQLELVLKDDLG
ncbi:MAG: UPF0179 family protein [Candidatus Odinarchaeia archaeon]